MRRFPLGPDDIEQFHRSFVRVLKMSEDMFNNFNKWMIKGPRADVIDRGEKVLVRVEAPGLSDNQVAKWAYRTSGNHLYLKGTIDVSESVRDALGRYYSERRNESFTRYIPLPAPVRNRVRSAQCRNGLLCLEFDKSDGGGDGSWQEIRMRSS